MKIGILQTGSAPEEMQPKHGDYDQLFINLLSGRGFEFITYPVLNNIFPENVEDADGWLITGSKFGVYEDHNWIPPLEDLLREAYARKIPIIGVCFGHQILAQALGGKVEKYTGGWSVGAVGYTLADQGGQLTALAWHQDQVIELPKHAKIIGSSEFCQNAMLLYEDRALTIQPHPEFTKDFITDLLKARKSYLPEDVAKSAYQSLCTDLSTSTIADRFEAFFKMKRSS